MSTRSPEEDAAFRQAIDGENVTPLHPVEHEPETGSWAPLDLAEIVAGIQAGEIVGPVPTLMARTDRAFLLYPGEVHSLSGEPESGKGWITLAAAMNVITSGDRVLYLDFEDAPASIVMRLLALDTAADGIITRFAYVRPTDPFPPGALTALLAGGPYALAVIDGVSEAYALLGLDPADNLDVAKFLAILPRPIAEHGAAVLELDHVAKAKESRGRYALGAQHKLAGIAVAYSTDIIKAPSRADAGMIKIKVEKDRHGHVRGQAAGGVIALAHITPSDNGEHVTVSLDPPEVSVTETGDFRPTTLMERVSRYLEDEPGATLRTVRTDVSGKAAYVDQALRVLVAEGFVQQRPDGQARRHYVVNEYREDDDRVPVSQPCPDHVPDTGEPYRVPVSLPLQGDTDTGHGQDQNSPTVSRDTAAS